MRRDRAAAARYRVKHDSELGMEDTNNRDCTWWRPAFRAGQLRRRACGRLRTIFIVVVEHCEIFLRHRSSSVQQKHLTTTTAKKRATGDELRFTRSSSI